MNKKTFKVDLSDLTFSETFNLAGTDYNISLNPNDIYLDRTAPTFLGDKEVVDVSPRSQNEIEQMITGQLQDQGIPDLILNHTDTQDMISEFAEAFPVFSLSGIGLKALPLVVPQAAVGLSLPMLPIKAEIVFRGVPEIELSEELGSFQFFGGGVKLALDPFIPIPMFPVNIAVGAYTQKMALGSVFEANNTLLTLMAGKDLSLLLFGVGVYGAVGMESSNIEINYEYMNDEDVNDPLNGTAIKFDLKGENKFRTTIGGRIRLAVFNISADYTMGADNVLTAGVGISIR